MRKLLAALALLLCAIPAFAITLGQCETQADTRLAAIWPAVQTAIATCLASSDDCYTTWSTGGAPTLCNTLSADGSMCSMAQVDAGIPAAVLNADQSTCSVVSVGHTFSSQGITLPGTDIFAYRISTYHGALGRGVQACVRAKFNGSVYERCTANGPEAAGFTHAWAAAP
jgi:hypothetical protein